MYLPNVARYTVLSAILYFAWSGSFILMSIAVLLFISTVPITKILKMIRYLCKKTPQIPKDGTPDQKYCYEKLVQVSRSFSSVILTLPEELRESICLFYLVCRGLDTIEDDMRPDISVKEPVLRSFYKKLTQSGWNLTGFGTVPHEVDLLENFDRVINVLGTIKPKYFKVISDIAMKMGNGMADFLHKTVQTKEDYNLYCWYVAGLVGEGLSRLFVASSLEDKRLEEVYDCYRSMGLFLQKTNIIRDYLDDISQSPPRIWYPKVGDLHLEGWRWALYC
eukprot:TRINITY_DN995_c0_g2_i9.p1 TRINITY_DN995_c0_g2~~TRINITY_DN995_c0_g2_i9.p1  ORF type:complete len:278 (-),score=37.96 TRINITY_DN995_c0_g2_i9:763-1596(-)